MSDPKRRLFLAVDLDAPSRAALAACLAEELTLDDGFRVVPPENWHITLRFLGWATDVQRDLILASVAAAELPRRFRIRIRGLGAFPRPRKATVLWLGAHDEEDRLSHLATAAEEAAVAAGFDPEDRPFHPHLTLARMRPQVDVEALVDEFDACAMRTEVRGITLFESKLSRGGARYEVLDSVPLR